MYGNKVRNNVMIVSILIYYLVIGRVVKYIASTDSFINFAIKINFSINHLSNYLNIILYLIQLLLYFVFFRKDVSCISIYNGKLTPSINKKRIYLLILFFTIFAFMISSFVIPIGTKYNNSIIGSVVSFILIVLCAPIIEELYFRVILMNNLIKQKKISLAKVIILQAVLFYLPHMINGNYTLYTFYLGIISGIFYYYTSSIVYSILLHSCANFSYFILTQNIINYRIPFNIILWLVIFLLLFVIAYNLIKMIISTAIKYETPLNFHNDSQKNA